jgi:hypothetical protein
MKQRSQATGSVETSNSTQGPAAGRNNQTTGKPPIARYFNLYILKVHLKHTIGFSKPLYHDFPDVITAVSSNIIFARAGTVTLSAWSLAFFMCWARATHCQ